MPKRGDGCLKFVHDPSIALPARRSRRADANKSLRRYTKYDAAGNLIRMELRRDGPCLGGTTCSQRFAYEWDEVGRLVRARRWDTDTVGDVDAPLPTPQELAPASDLTSLYDAGDQRVLKTATDAGGEQSHTAYVFESLELRRAPFIEADGDYELSEWTEVPYLFANGARLARVVHHTAPNASGIDMPELDDQIPGRLHVLLELEDHLGSTSVVLDQASGELVERATFYGYGGTESDYRPGRADLNLYAYVSGEVLKVVDPMGLQDKPAEGRGDPAELKVLEERLRTADQNLAEISERLEGLRVTYTHPVTGQEIDAFPQWNRKIDEAQATIAVARATLLVRLATVTSQRCRTGSCTSEDVAQLEQDLARASILAISVYSAWLAGLVTGVVPGRPQMISSRLKTGVLRREAIRSVAAAEKKSEPGRRCAALQYCVGGHNTGGRALPASMRTSQVVCGGDGGGNVRHRVRRSRRPRTKRR